ncbi:MAG: exo-alpha-sialidase [Pirellulales bacterium]
MFDRRTFLKASAAAGAFGVLAGRPAFSADEDAADGATNGNPFQLSLEAPTRLFDGKRCWCHPRAGIVPGAGKDGGPRAVMTLNTLDLAGSDVFKGVFSMETDDLGLTWTEPVESRELAPRFETIDGERRPVAASDLWPAWHAASKTLLVIGHTVVYTPDWKVARPRPRHTAYATYDADNRRWRPWRKLEMPAGAKYHDAGSGCVQRYDLDGGEILLPFYFRPNDGSSRVAVARCSFDGETLKFIEHGNELSVKDKTRGLHEPSLARWGGEFFLTIRNDDLAYVTRSRDGQQFAPIRPWTFDDGEPLGSYNTQQHWVVHRDALYLVYTRRGANNDHIFRHRAPLFIARVDTKRLRVLRETERVLVPERGPRMGNFGVTNVNENETWVTVAEWMQPNGVEKRGADGSVFVARIGWARPNRPA